MIRILKLGLAVSLTLILAACDQRESSTPIAPIAPIAPIGSLGMSHEVDPSADGAVEGQLHDGLRGFRAGRFRLAMVAKSPRSYTSMTSPDLKFQRLGWHSGRPPHDRGDRSRNA